MMNSVKFLFVVSVLFFSCEDPIEVELNEPNSKLVIEAYVNWIKETNQTEQVVLLSTLNSFFSTAKIPVNGAKVSFSDENATRYLFKEIENSGRYVPIDTIPYALNQQFTLHVAYNEEYFEASETFHSVASIDRIEQEELNFFGEEALKFEVYSFDPEDEENYSLFEYESSRLDIPEYNVYRDDFTNGIEYYGILVDSDFVEGDTIRFRQYGLSSRGFSYLNLLVLQNTQQGGPFLPPPVNLNGNIFNVTNPENNPLGYFRISEVSELNYVVR